MKLARRSRLVAAFARRFSQRVPAAKQVAEASQRASATDHVPPLFRRGEYLALLRLPDALDGALASRLLPRLLAADAHAPLTRSDAFAAWRLDRSYAACYRVLHEAACRLPGYVPRSMLEFGATLAPGCWAAHALWQSAPTRCVAVEPNDELRSVGAELSNGHGAAGPVVLWSARMPPLEVPGSEASRAGGVAASRFDLVVAPFSVSALPPELQAAALDALWQRVDVGGVLALIEDASTEGAECLRRGRRYLGEQVGARHVAPFPGVDQLELLCEAALMIRKPDVLAQAELVSLKQAVVESGARRAVERSKRRGREWRAIHERFAYVLVARDEANAERRRDRLWAHAPFARVITQPRKRRNHVLLDVITPAGELALCTVAKSKVSRVDYRFAKRAQQGNTIPMALLATEADTTKTKF